MKRIVTLGAAVLAVAFSVSIARAAETTVGTNDVTVGAKVLGASALYTDVKLIADNTDPGSRVLRFGDIAAGASAWSNKPLEYVQITVDDNHVSADGKGWRLRTYTNNFPALNLGDADQVKQTTTTWGYNFGGLKGDVNSAKAAMGWWASTSTVVGGPVIGNPEQGLTNGFTFLKDGKDFDDPSTVEIVGGVNKKDESFTASDAAGYCNVAFGSPSFTRVVKPATADGNLPTLTPTTPFYYYVGANFNGAAKATYDTKIMFDLIEQ
ncbi:MAG: hypothetical protein IPP35_08920 [Elusimicrobia bacterium]|nr:hypothetical protein [Elusimicrobiota bacterium]